MIEALYFKSSEHQLFAWYHRPPAGNAAKFALVVCKPFGYEAICAHRSIRSFSEAAAAIGVPTLRFDYAGTGDSSEIDTAADQLELWIQDVAAAVREVRRLSGLQSVYLLGFRLGAMIAVLAAVNNESVAGLILVAPIINGRRFVRELRTMRLAATIGKDLSADTGVMEVSGFLLSAATMRTLANVDLKLHGMPRTADVLVIDGASLPLARTWTDEIGRSGVTATYRSLPGMVEMLMTAPQFAQVPAEMISAMREWLMQRQGSELPVSSDVVNQEEKLGISSPTVMTLPSPPSSGRAAIVERSLFLGPGSLLFGIVTEPAAGSETDRAVLLINAGADYHIGASGINVALARRWARSGYVVLRMDLAGLGDSTTRPGRPDNEVFPPGATDDIDAAVEWMRMKYGVCDISMVGLCSGAFHTLQSAIGTVRINRAMMVNPETYFWNAGMSIYDRQTVELVRQRDSPSNSWQSMDSWKRLFRGQIDLRYVLGTYTGRLSLRLESALRNLARRLKIPLPNDLGRQLEGAAARGVQLTFVFSRGEPGLRLLALQGGISLERADKRCRIHIVDDADHVFSTLASRLSLEAILTAELTKQSSNATGPGIRRSGI